MRPNEEYNTLATRICQTRDDAFGSDFLALGAANILCAAKNRTFATEDTEATEQSARFPSGGLGGLSGEISAFQGIK